MDVGWTTISLAKHENSITTQLNQGAPLSLSIPADSVESIGWANITGTSISLDQVNVKGPTWWAGAGLPAQLQAMNEFCVRPPWPSLLRKDDEEAATCLFHSLPRFSPVIAGELTNDLPFAHRAVSSGFTFFAGAAITGSLALFSGTNDLLVEPAIPAQVFGDTSTVHGALLENQYQAELDLALDHDDVNDFSLIKNVPPSMVEAGGSWWIKLLNASTDLLDQTIMERRRRAIALPWKQRSEPWIHQTAIPGRTELLQQEAAAKSIELSEMMMGAPDQQSRALRTFTSGTAGAGRTWWKADPVSGFAIPAAFVGPGQSSWVLASMLHLHQLGSRYGIQIGSGSMLGTFVGKPNDLINVSVRYGSTSSSTHSVQVFRNGSYAGNWTSSASWQVTGPITASARPGLTFRDLFVLTSAHAAPLTHPRWEGDVSSEWLYGAPGWKRALALSGSNLLHGSAPALTGGAGAPAEVFVTSAVPPNQPWTIYAPGAARWQHASPLGHRRAGADSHSVFDRQAATRPAGRQFARKQELMHDQELLGSEAELIMYDHDGSRAIDKSSQAKSNVLQSLQNVLKLFS